MNIIVDYCLVPISGLHALQYVYFVGGIEKLIFESSIGGAILSNVPQTVILWVKGSTVQYCILHVCLT